MGKTSPGRSCTPETTSIERLVGRVQQQQQQQRCLVEPTSYENGSRYGTDL